MENQQIKFSTQTVSFAIEDMLKRGGSHLFYSNVVDGDRMIYPCILRKHLLDVVIGLQDRYRGRLLVSRTPGGLVVDKILSHGSTNGS